MKIKNKFFPRNKSSIPIAKKNIRNQIITEPVQLKKVYVKHFQHRMRKRPILPQYRSYQNEIEDKFANVLKITQQNRCPDWTLSDLDKVLKTLKRSQSQDSMGLVNELFMLENIGIDLKLSVLQLFNKIKNTNEIPMFF